MEALLRGNLFPKVVEAYSRPTRIVRGKEVSPDMEVPLCFIIENLSFGHEIFLVPGYSACPEVFELLLKHGLYSLKKLTA